MSRSARPRDKAAPCCLLESIRGLLERTYLMRPGLGSLDRFIVGDRGYQQFYGIHARVGEAGSAAAEGAKTLVRETAGGVRATIYFPDAQVRLLERFPPQAGLSDENLDAFGALVEELDHLLMVAERSRLERQVTLFELELHANVSKYLVLVRFLAGSSGHVDPAGRLWLRSRLFDDVHFCDEDPAIRERYRGAMRWAVKFLDLLATMDPPARLGLLRKFHPLPASEKIRLIRAAPV
jgi:hypothetical protein